LEEIIGFKLVYGLVGTWMVRKTIFSWNISHPGKGGKGSGRCGRVRKEKEKREVSWLAPGKAVGLDSDQELLVRAP
jgi:hypothetical protein